MFGYLRRQMIFGAVIAGCFFVARSCKGEDMPNPDQIRMVQEREARELRVRDRIEYQLSRAPKPKAEPKRPARLSDAERRELIEALDRFIREGRGLVILDPYRGVR
ncbi:MAG: hypothetical protein ACM3S5_18845 [Rhodospirillales bacterium]